MKKIFLFLIFFLIFSFQTSATVGGPEYISEIKYFPEENEIRYIYHYENGVGCPPTVEAYSIDSGMIEILLPCNLQLNQIYNEEKTKKDFKKIRSNLMADGIELKEVDLNSIDLDINPIPFKMVSIDEYQTEYIWQIKPIINNKEKNEFPIILCKPNDKANFTLLGIPGKNFAVIIANAVSICFEGLYTADTFIYIENIDLSNAEFLSPYTRGPKGNVEITKIPNKLLKNFSWSTSINLINDEGPKKTKADAGGWINYMIMLILAGLFAFTVWIIQRKK